MITGKKLEMARRIKGLSQEYVSSKLNISQTTLSRMSSSEKEISDDLLNKYLDILEENKDWVETLDERISVYQTVKNVEKNGVGFGVGFVKNNYAADNKHISDLVKIINDLKEIINNLKK